jgi:hypothetical protein
MKYKIVITILLLCLTLAILAVGARFPHQEAGKPKSQDIKKTSDAKQSDDGKKTDEKKTVKPTPGSTITLRIEVSAQGMDMLPTGSSIQLKGDDGTCKQLEQEQSINSDQATFTNLPVCKVKLRIYITGFDGKTVLVDLAKYKDPMRIQVKSNGPPVVN